MFIRTMVKSDINEPDINVKGIRTMQKLNKLSVNFKNFDILLRKYIYTLLKMLVIKF